VEEIKATSRRGFLKQAAAQHERYARKLKPILGQLEELKGRAIETVKGEVRAETEAAWGRPTSGPGQPATEQAPAGETRRPANFKEAVMARVKGDPNFDVLR
jgi:hypothetical protein